jgi:HK97 family phage prohead protease
MSRSLHEWERRAIGDVQASGRTIIGRAVVFGSPSRDLGGFVEVIRPEAVDRTLREGIDVRALVDHDPAKVLGRTTAGTLRLAKDDHGLRVEIDMPATTYGNDVLESVSRRDVSGMSFSFAVVRPGGERFEPRNGQVTRVITDMLIQEISIVTFPAYEATDVQVARRALLAAIPAGQSVAWLRMRADLR